MDPTNTTYYGQLSLVGFAIALLTAGILEEYVIHNAGIVFGGGILCGMLGARIVHLFNLWLLSKKIE